MAIAGGAVPALQVWLDKVTGELKTGYSGAAAGVAVVDDVGEVYRRIKDGKVVLMHRYADNFIKLKGMVSDESNTLSAGDAASPVVCTATETGE